MQKLEPKPDPTLQAAYRALMMDPTAPLPDTKVPLAGIAVHDLQDADLVASFERFIRPRHSLATLWQQHKRNLTDYIARHDIAPRDQVLDEAELKAASPHDIADFKLMVGMLNLFAMGKRGFLGRIEEARLRPVSENTFRTDPMILDIVVTQDTEIEVKIGKVTKTFSLQAGANPVEVLARNEAARMKPWHGRVTIKVPGEWRIPLEPRVSINWNNPIKMAEILPAATGAPHIWKRDPLFVEIDSKRNTPATLEMGPFKFQLELKTGRHQYEVIPPFGAANLRRWQGTPKLVIQDVPQAIGTRVTIGSWPRLQLKPITPLSWQGP